MTDSQILDSSYKMGTESTNRKGSTKVSIIMKPSMESDWISASEALLE
ncbi:hypothetical protein METP1_01315 [Methanosarcinales archaeon]|nr:hypothetical protein METP1_01315 [Methanosarcinales archaeon]